MAELDLEVLLDVAPSQQALASLPLHAVWTDSVDWSQAHLIELALLRHTLHVELECLAILNSFNAEIEPGVIVASLGVWCGIPRHVASIGVSRAVLC